MNDKMDENFSLNVLVFVEQLETFFLNPPNFLWLKNIGANDLQISFAALGCAGLAV